jgi:hypothetical protein
MEPPGIVIQGQWQKVSMGHERTVEIAPQFMEMKVSELYIPVRRTQSSLH